MFFVLFFLFLFFGFFGCVWLFFNFWCSGKVVAVKENRAFSVIFGNVPKQSEISEIFGNRICWSPRRGGTNLKAGKAVLIMDYT